MYVYKLRLTYVQKKYGSQTLYVRMYICMYIVADKYVCSKTQRNKKKLLKKNKGTRKKDRKKKKKNNTKLLFIA